MKPMSSSRFVSVFALAATVLCAAAPAGADVVDSPAGAPSAPALSPGVIALRIVVSPEQEQKARRFERRLRVVRLVAQIVDGLVSSAGYSRYARTCLSCIAFPRPPVNGGLRRTSALRFPAEADPVVQPISHGGFAMLALGALAYDLIDARVERHWSPRARIAADAGEIALHAYGVASWQAANAGLAVEEQRASNCSSLFRTSNPARFANYSGAIQWCVAHFADPDFAPIPQTPIGATPGRRP
ncbi:MAG: hypothetical protein ABI346_05720 [Candidatus Baltobacteraceae bacterium]